MAELPWTPVESEPDEGWPWTPDTVPVVVRKWRRLETGEATPDLPTTGGLAASVKPDWSSLRAGRFVEAWRRLLRDGATPDTVEPLHRAGMLVPLKGR